MSLGTRCPKEALRLAGMLEYHTIKILSYLQACDMNYKEMVALVKEHWAKVLQKKKAEIDQLGLLSPKMIGLYQSEIENSEDMIAHNWPEEDLVYPDGSIVTQSQKLTERLTLFIFRRDHYLKFSTIDQWDVKVIPLDQKKL